MKLPPMNALRMFEAVSRLGSVSKAAEELCVSQGAVSQQLRNLEDNLGRELFIRSPSAFTLSEDGEEFAGVVQQSLKDISLAASKVKREKPRNTLTISAAQGIGVKWLMPRLGDFYESHPDITIALDLSADFATFGNDGIDAAIRFGEGNFEGLDSVYLFSYTKFAVASPGYIAEFGKLDDLERPEGHRLIDNQFSSKILNVVCGRWEDIVADDYTGLDDQLINLPDGSQALNAAIHGRGITMMPRYIMEDEINSGNIVYANKRPVPFPGSYYFVSPAGVRPDSRLEAFRDWLVEKSGEFRAEEESF